MFLRFAISRIHPESGADDGIFSVAYALRDSCEVSEGDRRLLADLLSWFDQNLQKPVRFNRSKSKGYYRRAARGIAWFRDTAEEYLSRMYELKRVVESNGHFVGVIRQERIGYVVYEDEFQAIAEPFSETQTSV